MIKPPIFALLLAACLLSPASTQEPGPFPTGFSLPASLVRPQSRSHYGAMESFGPESPESRVCPAVWDVDGSLCKGDDLLRFNQAEVEKIKSAVSETREILLKVHRTELELNQKSDTGRLLFRRDLRSNYRVPRRRMSHVFRDLSESLPKCWDYLERSRNASLCYICSKENRKYFLEGKALVGEDDCSQMLDNCMPFYSHLPDFATDLKTAVEEISESTPKSESLKGKISCLQKQLTDTEVTRLVRGYHNKKKKLHHLDVQVRRVHQSNALQRVKDMKEAERKTAVSKFKNVKDQLCVRLFRLHKSPHFGVVRLLAAEYLHLLEPAAAANSRVLLDDPFGVTTNPFGGDVAVLRPEDNMFVSFDGSQGTTLNVNNNEDFKLLNLSLLIQ